MARVRLTAESVAVRAADDVDLEKVRQTTEADIQRHAAEDGEDADGFDSMARSVVPAAIVRAKTGLNQEQFARALRIPVGTLRAWEQGRKRPDPAANSLLALVFADPERMFSLLQAAE